MIAKWGGAFLFFLLGAAGCSLGVGRIREAAANRAPTEASCADLEARRFIGSWVHLTGASGTLAGAGVRSKNGVADRLYVPLTCDGSTSSSVRVLMATENPSLLAAVKAKRDAEIPRDVKGMVRDARSHSSEITSGAGLDRTIDRLALDYVVLEDGGEPSLLAGLAWLAGSIAGWVLLWRTVRS